MIKVEPLHDNHIYECATHPCNKCKNPNVTCMTTGNHYHEYVAQYGFWCSGDQNWQHFDYMTCDKCDDLYKKSIVWDNDVAVVDYLESVGISSANSTELHLCPDCISEIRRNYAYKQKHGIE